IGTLRGGTFYIWSRYLDSAEHLVSLDLPGRDLKRRRDDMLEEFAPSKQVDVVRGNSHDEDVYREVADVFDVDVTENGDVDPESTGVDFLFVDGDHSYEGVKQDFEDYSRLVNDGGVVAFHDIVPHADSWSECRRRLKQHDDLEERHVGVGHPEWDVAGYWDEISGSYETEEIVAHPAQAGKGIGVVYL
ncbi:MAG: class I SAM-dependent methyltransferase, partial [Halobacteriota archaeon]